MGAKRRRRLGPPASRARPWAGAAAAAAAIAVALAASLPVALPHDLPGNGAHPLLPPPYAAAPTPLAGHGALAHLLAPPASAFSSSASASYSSTLSTPGGFANPSAVAVGPSGRIVVGDADQRKVHVFHPNGSHALSFDVGTAGDAAVIVGIAVDGDGRIVVADRKLKGIRTFNPDGTAAGYFGNSDLEGITGVDVDRDGRIILAEAGKDIVLAYTADGDQVSNNEFAPFSALGALDSPVDVAAFPSGKLVVVDSATSCIYVVSGDGTKSTSFGLCTGSSSGSGPPPQKTSGSGGAHPAAGGGVWQALFPAPGARAEGGGSGGPEGEPGMPGAAAAAAAWPIPGAAAQATTECTAGTIKFPAAAAADPSGSIVVANDACHMVHAYGQGGALEFSFDARAGGGSGEVSISSLAADPSGRIVVADSGRDTVKVFTVSDAGAPRVTGVAARAGSDSLLAAGESAVIDVTFSAAVSVDTASGSPYLELDAGAAGARAVHVPGPRSSTTVSFNYTARAGDESADLGYGWRGALKPGGANITSAAGIEALTRLPAPGAANSLSGRSAVAVDGAAPGVANITSGAGAGPHGAGADIRILVEFDEAVAVTGSPALRLNASAGAAAAYAGSAGASALEFNYTVRAGDPDSILGYDGAEPISGGTIRDAAGNPADRSAPAAPGAPGSLAAASAVRIDGTAPRIVAVDSGAPAGPHGPGASIRVNVTFGEAVRVSGAPSLALNAGAGAAARYDGGGNNTDTLSFLYAVRTGDRAAALGPAGAEPLSGGTVRDAAGNPANRTVTAAAAAPLAARAVAVDARALEALNVTSDREDGTYTQGDEIAVRVRFAGAVEVLQGAGESGGGGLPSLALRTFPVNRTAAYAEGNNTDTLVFRYAVQPGDNARGGDLGYWGVGSLSANGAAVRSGGTAWPGGFVLPAPGAPGSLSRNGDVDVETTASAAYNGTLQGAPLHDPYGAAVDAHGRIFVADRGHHAIRAFHPDGTYAFAIGAIGQRGAADGELAIPRGVAVDPASGRIVVADTENSRIQAFHPNGTLALRFGGVHPPVPLEEDMRVPRGVAVGPDGRIVVADTGRQRIKAFHPNGTLDDSFGQGGSAGAGLSNPSSVAVDPLSGRIFVASMLNNAVVAFHPNGTLDDSFGRNGRAMGSFSGPEGVAVDPASGRIVVADTGNRRIKAFHPNGLPAFEIGPGLGAGGQLRDPKGVAVDPSGRIVVTDSGADSFAAGDAARVLLIADPRAPYVKNVTARGGAGEGALAPGDSVAIDVAFDRPVLVDYGRGEPSLVLETGAEDRRAAHVRGTPGAYVDALSFNYTVRPGDGSAALGYSWRGSLDPGGAYIAERPGGVPALPALPPPGGPNSLAGTGSPAVDGVPPRVVNATADASGSPYGPGDTVDISVAFDEAVRVADAPAPRPRLDLGGGRTAPYEGGSGTAVLTFRYAVEPGHNAEALGYAGRAALAGGAVTDLAGNAANLTLPEPGAPGSLLGGPPGAAARIDTAPPSVLSVSSPNDDGTYAAGSAIGIDVEFDERVLVAGSPSIGLDTTPPRSAAYGSGGGTAVLTFVYTVQAGDSAADLNYASAGALSADGAITDLAGNAANRSLPSPSSPGSLGHSSNIVVVAAPPAAPSDSPPGAAPQVAPPVILTAPSTTASAFQELRGTAAPGSTITASRGGSALGSSQADPVSGYWTLGVALVEGINELSVAATAGGATSNASLVDITLDTTPPPAPTILNTAGESAPSRMHVIRGTAEPGSLVEVRVNGTLRGSASAHYGATGAWFIQVQLEAGSNNVSARAVDGIGNPSAFASVIVTAPAGPPPSSTLDKPPVPTAAIHDGDGTFALASPTSVKALESGGRAYALVAAGGSAAVQVVDFTDPGSPVAAATIREDGRSLGWTRDVELFATGSGRFAAVTSLSPGSVELVDVTDPLNPRFSGSADIEGTDADGAPLYPQLLGARDAAVFGATVNGTAGTYLMVVSDYGPTALSPGGFQIINVTHPPAPTPVSDNHAVFRDGQGRHVTARPPTEVPRSSPITPITLQLADPQVVAIFDADGDPVAKTVNHTLPGYGTRNFSVPVEGLYTSQSYRPNPAYSLSLNTVMETRNSTGHTVSLTRNGEPFPRPETCNPGPYLSVCSDQYRLFVMNNNDTAADRGDDWIMEVYQTGLYGYPNGHYGYPVARLVGGKMLSVGVDGNPLPLRGVDPDGRAFEALEGARSVDTFASGGGVYAVVAARDADAVQVINVTDPTRPRAVAEARDGRTDGRGGTFDKLAGAEGVAIAQVGGRAYAVVAASDDDGVQIIDVTDPASPRAVSSVADEPGSSRNRFSMLGGATGVEIFVQNSRTYALVSSWDDDGFQVIDITNPASPAAADRGHDGNRCSTAARYSALGGALASDTLAFNGRLYAVVAANFDDGLQVVDVTDPDRLVVRGAVFDELGGFSELTAPISAHAAEIKGREYVFVASYQHYTQVVNGENFGMGGGVQIVDVTDPSSPRAAAALGHSDRSQFALLHGVRGIDTFAKGARTYAIITAELALGHSQSDDKGAFTIVDVTDPERPRFMAGARDGQPDPRGNKFDMLNAPAGVDTAVIGGKTYAVIAARGPYGQQDHGVQIVDVSDPRSPLAVASIRDGDADGAGGTFDTLKRAHGVEIVQIGSGWYALVAAIRDDGVQVIEITDPSSPRAAASIVDDETNTALGGAYEIRAFEKGGKTYAIVSAKNDDGVQVLNITDPSDPDPIDGAVDHRNFANNREFSELLGAHGVDLFTHGGNTYAAVASVGEDHDRETCRSFKCSGVQIIDMSNPAQILAHAVTWDHRVVGAEATHIRGARGIATFTAGESVYAAVTGYTGDQVQIMRLVAATDGRAPAAVGASLNKERGLLYIEFDELVKTSSSVDLSLVRIRDGSGSVSAAVPLGGASLADASDGKTVVIALTDAQRAAVAAVASPVLEFTSAGAFEDLAGNDLPARGSVAAALVTSSPELLGARIDLGTGEIAMSFTEAVNSSEVDLSRIAVYSSDAPRPRYSPSAVATEGGNTELSVRLGLHERQAVINLTGTPLLDVLAGAANSSETGRPSAEYRGSPFRPITADRVDPELVSATLDGDTLTIVFDEYVNVRPSRFDLDQMYLRDADGGAGDEVRLYNATLLTDRNGTSVALRLNATQAAAAAGYARVVLDMRLSGPYSAVEDLSGQGIGEVRGQAVLSTRDRAPPGFSATATALDRIAVNFTEPVTGAAGATWRIAGDDAAGLAVAGYAGVRGDSVVLELNGLLPDTSPDVTLTYVRGDIADEAANPLRDGAAVQVLDGLAPEIASAAVTGPNEATIAYSEPVRAPPGGAFAPELGSGGGPRTVDRLAPRAGGGEEGEADTIVFGGQPAPTNATGTLAVDQTLLVDLAGNAMGANRSHEVPLADGQGPRIESALMTGHGAEFTLDEPGDGSTAVAGLRAAGSNFTIRYSEPASAPLSAYEVAVGGAVWEGGMLADAGAGAAAAPRPATALSGNGTDTHVVAFGGAAAVALGAAGNVTIDATAVLDAAAPRPNPLGADAALVRPLGDGRAPDIVSARVTGPGNATVTYGEAFGAASRWAYPALTVGGEGRAPTALAGGSPASAVHTITFGGEPAPANATGMIAILADRILAGRGGAALGGGGGLVAVLEDGQAPSLAGAAAVSGDTIRVEFDEPVFAPGALGGAAGWTVSGPNASGLAVASSSGASGGSAVLSLALSGSLNGTRPDATLSYAPPAGGAGGIADAAGNAAPSLSIKVGDGLAPLILWGAVTGPNAATIRYSEPVNASSLSAYPGIALDADGGSPPRAVTSLSGNGTAAHVLAFGGAEAPPAATGTATVDWAHLSDASGNSPGPGAARTVGLEDRQAIEIESAAVTAPGEATITYSRAVGGTPADYAPLTVAGLERTVSSVSGGGTDTHVIAFAPAGAPANATGSVTINAPAVADQRGVALGAAPLRQDLADGQAPSMAGANATSLATILVSFDEPVSASGAGGAGWTLSGANASGRAVSSVSPVPGGPAILNLTLDGDLAGTRPDGIALSYAPGGASIADASPAGNALAPGSVSVRDAIPPAIASAKITAGRAVEVNYTEQVYAGASAYARLELDRGGDRGAPALSSGNGTGTVHALAFGGAEAAANDTAWLTVDQTQLTDAYGNPAGPSASFRQRVGDGQAPGILDASATSLTTIRVEFDEPVRTADLAGAGWSLSGANASGLAVASSSDVSGGSAVLNLTLDGGLASTRPDGVTLSYDGGRGAIVDEAGGAGAPGNALASASAGVGDAIPPGIMSARVTGSNAVTVNYTEPVVAGAQAYSGAALSPGGARAVTAVSGSATASHVVAFGGAGAAANATGTLTVNRAQLLDASGNAAGPAAPFQLEAADGQAPAVLSANITGANELAIAYSEPVTAQPSAYSGLVLAPGGPAPGLAVVSGSPSAVHTITFAGAAAAANATGTVDVDPALVADEAGNTLGPGAPSRLRLGDGQAPAVTGAEAVSPTEIRVRFDETVSAAGTAGHGGWSISGGDSNSRVVSSRSDISAGSTALVLTLDGGLADDSPSGVELSYAPGAAAAPADAAGNALGSVLRQAVGDGIRPRVLSASITAGNTLAVAYSEPVAAQPSAYSGLVLAPGGPAPGLAVVGAPPSAVHTITFAGAAAAANATGTLTVNQTALADEAGNALGTNEAFGQRVADGQAPEIRMAAITAGNNVTITYTEPVTAAQGAYAGLELPAGNPRMITAVSGNATDRHVIAFGGAPAAQGGTGRITIDATAVLDAASPRPNALGADESLVEQFYDDRTPLVVSAKVTGPNNATIQYSRNVTAQASHYTQLTVDGLPRSVLSLAGGDNTKNHTIAFDGSRAPPNATGSVEIDAPAVADASGVPLGSASLTRQLADGQDPSLVSAAAVSLDTIRATFDEPVNTTAAAGAGWSIAGMDSNGLGVASGSDLAAGSAVLTLTLDGSLPDTRPDGITLRYDSSAGGIADLAANPLKASSEGVGDGIAPEIVSAAVTAPRNVTVTYSEPVASAAGAPAYAGLELSTGGGATRGITALSGNATDTHVITFDGAAAAANATGTLTVNQTALADEAGNALGTSEAFERAVADAQAPKVLSAAITAGNAVTVVYTEPVASAAGASEYTDLELSTGGGATRNVTALSGNATDTHVVTFSGVAAAANATGTLTVNQTALADEAGNALGTNEAFGQPVADGQAPKVLSANITAGNAVTVVYTEPVASAAGASEYTDLALSTGGAARTVTALSGNATDTHVITFDGAAAAANATGTLTVNQTALADEAGNALGTNEAFERAVADGQAPKVLSAAITAGNAVTVVYTEPVASAAGASEYTDLALSTDGGAARTVAALSGNATDTHVITFDGAAAAANATGTLTVNQTALADEAGNALGSSTSFGQPVADGQAPEIRMAAITAGNNVTITYTEPVTAAQGAYAGLELPAGTTRMITAVSGNATDRHVIAFGGAPAAQGGTGRITIDATAVLDAALPRPNALGADESLVEQFYDGRTPLVVSAKVAGPYNATIQYSRPVTAQASHYTQLTVDGLPRSVLSLAGGADTDTHTIAFDGSRAPPNATGSVEIDAPAVADASGVPLGSAPLTRQLADGQAPSLVSAAAVSLDTIRAAFDEPVNTTTAAAGAAGAGWSIAGMDSNGLGVASGSDLAAGSAVLTLTLGGSLPDTRPDGITLRYDPSAGGIADLAANPLKASSEGVGDGIAPEIVSAAVTAPRNVTVTYSEPVASAAGAPAYAGLALSTGGGATRNVTALSGNATDTHVVAFSGAAAAANATGTLTVNQTALADEAGNALGTDGAFAQQAADAQAPRIVSASITAPNTVTVLYSEAVASAAGAPAYAGLALSTGGGATRNVTALSGNATDTHVVAFSGAAAAANATGTLTVNQTALADEAGNALGTDGAFAQQAADAQAPRIVSASITAPNTVTVLYSEAVASAAGAPAYAGLALSTGGGATRNVTALSGNATDTHVVAFSGAAAATGSAGTLTVNQTALADEAGNALGTDGAFGQQAADGQAPRIVSASITAPNTVAVLYSEAVTAALGAYAGLALEPGGDRAVTGIQYNGTEEHEVAFGGAAAAPGATGTITIDATAVLDAASPRPNALGASTALVQPVSNSLPQAPVPHGEARARAAFTSPGTVTVVYTGSLGAPPGHDGPVYGSITINAANGSLATVPPAGESGVGTAVHTVALGGGARVGSGDTGTIALEVGLEGAGYNGSGGSGGAPIRFDDLSVQVESGASARTFAPPAPPSQPGAGGQQPPPPPPVVLPVERDGFTRALDASGSGDSARPAINVTGLAADGGGGGGGGTTVVFPGSGSTAVIASFASVSFPAGVAATSVPADGRLDLYVSGDPPTAGQVAAALGVDASRVAVKRVVEVGDDAAHIEFDMPVRVLLDGQAGGRAFYVNNTGGEVVPIRTACAADDTAAVHAQLGGARGACWFDRDGDKIVYTYHLTRFGTADAPTPLEVMVAEAAAGSVVRVPPGTYAEDVLVVNKSLAIEPADPGNPPLFTGYSHIVVDAQAGGPVAIRGLAFEDTAHAPGGGGLASIVVGPGAPGAAAGAAPVAIEGNTFRNTCDAGVRAAAPASSDAGPGGPGGPPPPIAGLAIENNRFYDIGGNSASCGAGGGAPAAEAARADAIVAGQYDAAAAAAGGASSPAQLTGMAVRDNYIFGTTYTGIRIAGADGLAVTGNHIEGVPDDGMRIMQSRNVQVHLNTIVGANQAPRAAAAGAPHDGLAGAAIEVWSGSDGVAVTLNRVSGSAGALLVCAGTCDPGPDAAGGTGGGPVPAAAVPVNAAGGASGIRFSHNVLAGSNTGVLVANAAGGELDARANYWPGHAASAAGRVSPAGAVLLEPALDDAGPVRIGAVVADGPSSAVRSVDSAVRAAFELGVHDFNAGQARAGGAVGLEPAVRTAGSPDYTAAARAGHASDVAALRSGASADARMLPVLHSSISSAMALYDASSSGDAALAAISAMGASHAHYPFVLDRSGAIVAHGADASLVGSAASGAGAGDGAGADAAAAGLLDFATAADVDGTGIWPGYRDAPWKWRAHGSANPATDAAEPKRSVLALHPGPDGVMHNADDLVFGAGYHQGPGAAHLVVAAGDAAAAAAAAAAAGSGAVVAVSPASTASQLAARDALFRLAPPDALLAGVVMAQALADRSDAAATLTIVALNDSASLQSMGLAGELYEIDLQGALPDGVDRIGVVSYNSSSPQPPADGGGAAAAAAGWAAAAAGRIREAASAPQQGEVAFVYSGRAGAFAALADALAAADAAAQPLPGARWYSTGDLARAELASSGPSAAALARAGQLAAVLQYAAPNAAIDAALAAPGAGIVLDESTRGPAYAAYDAPALLGRAMASTPGVPGAPAAVARAIDEDVARTHAGALGSPLILDRNGDLVLPIAYAVSAFPAAGDGAWAQLDDRAGERSCGIALAKGALDFGVLSLGRYSRPDTQTVINTGTLPYRSVTLDPGDWTYASGQTLPASITELRELGRAAAYAGAASGLVVAPGLAPGQDSNVQFRINLTAYQSLPPGQASQTINYLVECRAAAP